MPLERKLRPSCARVMAHRRAADSAQRVSKNNTDAIGYVCDGTEVASPVLKDGAAFYTPGALER